MFGAIRSQSGSSDNPWLFTGEQQDADEGLYYLRARFLPPLCPSFQAGVMNPLRPDRPSGLPASRLLIRPSDISISILEYFRNPNTLFCQTNSPA